MICYCIFGVDMFGLFLSYQISFGRFWDYASLLILGSSYQCGYK